MQTYHGWNANLDLIVKNCAVLILIEATAINVQRVWAVQATLLLATLWWIKGGLRLSAAGATFAHDRLMGPAVSMIENPNGYAYLMTVMIPLYLYFFQQTKNKYLKWAYLGLALAGVYIVLETGSRTGFLALSAVTVFLLPKYGARHKLALVVAAAAIFIFSSYVGSMNIERFKTIPNSISTFLSGARDDEFTRDSFMDADTHSAWERRMKNRHTWELIKEYPLFGVGIHANDALLPEHLSYAGGQVHNEILYAGKQMGIIGIGLYLSLMSCIFFLGWWAQLHARGWWPAVSDLGWTFKMQAVVFAVGGFFSPIPWNPIYLILAGSASALWTCLREKSYASPVS
jgi:hypothetical protein